MAESHDFGNIGEDLAVEKLKEKGYKILQRNWKTGRLEIDIIAENKEYIVFVEVKTRPDEFKEHPLYAINRDKRTSMILAADNYIKWNKIDKESRFDIITVIKKGAEFQTEHYEAAFYPTLR